MVKSYTPDRGDVVWVDFSPTVGREQRGHRPALVLSPRAYNDKSSLVIACPLTTHVKGYPFEVRVNFRGKAAVILADQVKSFDWRERKVTFGDKVDGVVLEAVNTNIGVLLDMGRD